MRARSGGARREWAATFRAATKQLAVIGSGILGCGLILGIVLGYSGDATLTSVGSFTMLITVPLGVLVLIAAGVSAAVSRPNSTPPGPRPGGTVPEQRLAALQRMHEAGDLTDEELEAKRRQVIAEM